MKITASSGDRIYLGICYTLLAVAVLICLYPLVYVVSVSISDHREVLKNSIWLLPKGFSLQSYRAVFADKMIWRYTYNTVLYAVLGTFLSTLVTVITAYPLSKPNFVLKTPFTIFMTITMLFSGGMIPTYLLMRNLGLYDNIWAMIIPTVSCWNVILVKTYIQQNVHVNVLESAAMDGANDLRTLFQIVLPLSKPIIALIVMYAVVGYWNSYFNAMLYLPTQEKQTLQVYLMKVLTQNNQNVLSSAAAKFSSDQLMMMPVKQLRQALIVVCSIPMLGLYACLHKHFEKGISIGSVKG